MTHALCRELMAEKGAASLEAAKRQNPVFKQVKMVSPHLTFDQGELSMRVGKKNLIMIHTPATAGMGSQF